jgi:hypothetical protein
LNESLLKLDVCSDLDKLMQGILDLEKKIKASGS